MTGRSMRNIHPAANTMITATIVIIPMKMSAISPAPSLIECFALSICVSKKLCQNFESTFLFCMILSSYLLPSHPPGAAGMRACVGLGAHPINLVRRTPVSPFLLLAKNRTNVFNDVFNNSHVSLLLNFFLSLFFLPYSTEISQPLERALCCCSC